MLACNLPQFYSCSYRIAGNFQWNLISKFHIFSLILKIKFQISKELVIHTKVAMN